MIIIMGKIAFAKRETVEPRHARLHETPQAKLCPCFRVVRLDALRGAGEMGCITSKSAKVAMDPEVRYKPSVIDKMSDAQLEEFREAFNMFDKDGGGSIDSSELKDLMKSVGQEPTEAELREMVAAADADGTGDIDFLEFAVLMAHKMQDGDDGDAIKKAFSIFDQSGDGFISAPEMRKMLVNLGEKVRASRPATADPCTRVCFARPSLSPLALCAARQITPADVEALIGAVDVDGDGQINYEEFSRILMTQASVFSEAEPEKKEGGDGEKKEVAAKASAEDGEKEEVGAEASAEDGEKKEVAAGASAEDGDKEEVAAEASAEDGARSRTSPE